MRVLCLRLFLTAFLGSWAGAQVVQPPEVIDRNLSNGVKVLVVERPGTGAAHAGLFIAGGRAATGNLSPAAADLLARCLFRRLTPASLGKDLDLPLRQEGAAFEGLRLERIRQARRPDREPSPELPTLQAMHRSALAAIQERLAGVDAWDALDALGATRRAWEVSADTIGFGVDLPAGQVAPWCRLEAESLAHPFLGRFPLERERLLQEMGGGAAPCAPTLSVLLSMALAGRPYAMASEFNRSDVEALGLADLSALARDLLVPDRLVLVLVGDVAFDALRPVLEATFGSLPRGPAFREGAPFKDDDPAGPLDSPAGRKLLVSTTGETRVIFGWRVPPENHPDGPALKALAQVLAGSPSSRLTQDLVGTRGLARTLALATGVPGGRDANLLTIDAEPAAGHSLTELEQAIEGEVLRLQREPLPDGDVHRAQVQMEALQIRMQEDAAVLAGALGTYQARSGDWRLAFRALSAGRDLKPSEIQAVARTYLVPARSTIARFAPDPLLQPMDRTEARLLQALSVLVQRRLGNPVEVQGVVREALRQLRMLNATEREQTLKLLEAQVAP